MALIVPERTIDFSLSAWLSAKDFTWENICIALRSSKSENVNLVFPQFKISSTPKLEGRLQDLGMKTAFGESADFDDMITFRLFQSKLKMDNVLHGSTVGVTDNEFQL